MYSNNTTVANNFEAVMSYLNGLDDNELVNVHNTYARENRSDDEIYYNDEEFFNVFFDGKVLEAVRAVSYGDYNYSHEYVMFNGYANLESFNNPSEHIDLTEIANDILENPDNYDIELQECFVFDGCTYEGTEEEAKEQYNEYLDSLEENEEPDTFELWVSDNIATID